MLQRPAGRRLQRNGPRAVLRRGASALLDSFISHVLALKGSDWDFVSCVVCLCYGPIPPPPRSHKKKLNLSHPRPRHHTTGRLDALPLDAPAGIFARAT